MTDRISRDCHLSAVEQCGTEPKDLLSYYDDFKEKGILRRRFALRALLRMTFGNLAIMKGKINLPVLSLHNLTMDFVERNLFYDISFDLEKGDKAGFIGANGAGKTTLFKIINGELSPAGGSVYISKDAALGYMEQHACNHPENSVYDELLSVFDFLAEYEKELNSLEIQIRQFSQGKVSNDSELSQLIVKQTSLIEQYQAQGGLTYKSRTRSALAGLGFKEAEFDMPVTRLSGGQRSKLNLAKLLLSRANLLLLDEPTNHLDIDSLAWLEGFIRDFKGSMLIVSHDRYFLDKVTNKTLELEHNRLRVYKGNYSCFMEKKKAEQEAVRNKYENDLKEIKRIEGIVEQQKRWGRERNFITAESRQKQADRIKEQLTPPDSSLEELRMTFNVKKESGKDVLICENLSKSFGDKMLFKNLNLHLCKGERVFILGANGCGKTTLFNILTGKIPPDAGDFCFGANAEPGYFDQMQNNLNLEKSPLDEVWDEFPNLTQTQVRTALGSFLFKGDRVFEPMKNMSGGERARVSLLKLMLKGGNLLLLDEPTNHLDASSREQLENTLVNYEGTVLAISHDRYFINKLADRVLVMEKDGFKEYLGNYDYYAEHISRNQENKVSSPKAKEEKPKNNWQLQKQKQSEERKRKTQLAKAEKLIEQLESETEKTNKLLQSEEVISDYEKLMELTEKLEELNIQLENAYDLWGELS